MEVDADRLRRLVAQHAETSRLFGVDFVPLGKRPEGIEVVQDIGRKGIFGNPFRPAPGEERQGKTLEPYGNWLFAAIKGEKWAHEQYREATGITLPSNFAARVHDLGDMPFRCPGCREETEKDGVCHGSMLRRAVKWLHTPEGQKYVH